MLQRIRQFAIDLHEDESGPNTVEWVLLVIVALVILLAIFIVADWAKTEMEDKKTEVEQDSFLN